MALDKLSSNNSPTPQYSRRGFIKICASSVSVYALPPLLFPYVSNSLVNAAPVEYNLLMNSGDNLLLNGGGFLLLAVNFPGPFDSDGDGLNDDVEVALGTDPGLPDTDGDNLLDGYEVGYDGDPGHYNLATDLNPLSADTDGDSFTDDTEVAYNSDPLEPASTPATGDLNEDGVVNAGDVQLAQRIATDDLTPSALQQVRGDVAPLINSVPAPDGKINAADLMVIIRKALGLTSF